MRIGIDVVSISQMAHSLAVSSTFASAVFAAGELEIAARMPANRANEFLAGRFAAKEAVLKALRLGIDDPLKMKEIQVTNEMDGSPSLSLTGSIARAAQEWGLSECQVSISHEANSAVAVALLS